MLDSTWSQALSLAGSSTIFDIRFFPVFDRLRRSRDYRLQLELSAKVAVMGDCEKSVSFSSGAMDW